MGAYEKYGMVCGISNMPLAMQHEHTHILQKRKHATRVSTKPKNGMTYKASVTNDGQ
jgi:hypothetical protein